jgi:hypothetical protein
MKFSPFAFAFTLVSFLSSFGVGGFEIEGDDTSPKIYKNSVSLILPS